MNTYTTMEKTDWGAGAWQHEPDKLSWTDDVTGLPCLIVRNRSGALCGYVGVASTHPWHGIGYSGHLPSVECSEEFCYDHSPDGMIEVHGGLTYAAGCQHGESEASGICHIPEPGQPDDVWWFGFDTAHFMDLCPAHSKYGTPIADETYKNVGYVTSEVANLARQLADITTP